jgi:hypothetical protein
MTANNTRDDQADNEGLPPGFVPAWTFIKPCAKPPRRTMTMTAERNAEAQAVERDIATIDQALDHLRRVTADTRMRYGNARDAAADLAASVYYFLDDPEGVGTDALRKAVSRYGQQSAGNFTDSAREAVGG